MHRAPLYRILLFVLVLVAPNLANAETAETKERSVLRLKPDRKARIVDRLAAGRKLLVLGLSPDGAWAHVRDGKRLGWVPVGQLKSKTAAVEKDGKGTLAETPAVDTPPPPPPPAVGPTPGTAPGGWSTSSKFAQEDSKVKVAVPKADVYGRPAVSGAPVATLRQGEVMPVLKKSADKNWYQVDLGGGEAGWVEAKNVRGLGAGPSAAPAIVAPPPPPATKTAQAPTPPPTRAAPVPPPQPTKAATPPVVVASEPPPPPKAKHKKERDTVPVIIEPIDAHPAAAPAWEATQAHGPGSNRIHVGAAIGIGSVTQTFTSNGARIGGDYTNYNFTSVGLGARVDATFSHQFGKHVLIGLDAAYAYAGLTSVKLALPPTDASGVRANGSLSVAAHQVDATPFIGFKFEQLRDLELRVHLGFDMQLNYVSGSANDAAQLPSDRTIGMSTGLTLAVPRLLAIAGRPFGIIWYGSFIGPATRTQNDADGTSQTTLGGSGGLFLKYGLLREAKHGQLSLQIGWDFGVLRTKFHGESARNPPAYGNVTEATRWTQHHLGLAGIDYTF